MRLRRVLVILFMKELALRVLREEEFDSFVESKCTAVLREEAWTAEHTAGCVFSNTVDRLL